MKYRHALEYVEIFSNAIRRSGWNGKGMFVFAIEDWTYTNGYADNYLNEPFLALKTADNKVIPWVASQADTFADDWEVVDPKTI